MFWAWSAVIAGFAATGIIGYCIRAFIGDRREDRAYDDGWDDALGDLAASPAPESSSSPKPSPASSSSASPPAASSPSSTPSSPPTFILSAAASSTPLPLSPSSLPPPLRRPWRWDDLSGRWTAQEPVESAFVRALRTVPLKDIPALFWATA
jgi:hypothetical protein